MKEKMKTKSRPRQNEQNDPVYCNSCGKQAKNGGEEGCVCEPNAESHDAEKLPAD